MWTKTHGAKPSFENTGGMAGYEAEEIIDRDIADPFKYITKINVYKDASPKTNISKLLKEISLKYPHIEIIGAKYDHIQDIFI